MRARVVIVSIAAALLAVTGAAGAPDPLPREKPAPAASSGAEAAKPGAAAEAPAPTFIDPCVTIDAAAREHGLPVAFFTRLIWQESSFKPDAVSPAGAQGIAQFMPGTAADRGLADPFEPVQAIGASAALLKDLRARFGNLGLAAAAYNAGPTRVDNWLAGTGSLPYETQRYVQIVTGHAAEEWSAGPDRTVLDAVLEPPGPPNADCRAVKVVLAARAPSVQTARITSPWGVQLAGSFSRGAALNVYANLKLRYGRVLASYDPIVITRRRRHFGTRAFSQVRVGAPSRPAADRLCTSLKAAGAFCLVLRN